MNRKKSYLVLFLIAPALLSMPAMANLDNDLKPVPERVKVGFDSITGTDAKNFVEFLAAPETEGRDTPSPGLKISRNYIRSLYKLWGVMPAGDYERGQRKYEQNFPITLAEPKETWIEIRKAGTRNRYYEKVDFFFRYQFENPPRLIEAPVVFVGYGIHAPDLKYDDFAGIDVRGKIILMLEGLPGESRKESPFSKPEVQERFIGHAPHLWFADTKDIEKRGPLAILVVSSGAVSEPKSLYKNPAGRSPRRGHEVILPGIEPMRGKIPAFLVPEHMANSILSANNVDYKELKSSIDTSLAPKSFDINSEIKLAINTDSDLTPSETANVVGIVEGSDPELKNEYILISAHLDHEGYNEDGYILPGADDNASGSAGVIELAQAFALNPVKPKRSILFVHWAGEERYCVGSRYFAENPTAPKEQIVLCINMDMIGRRTAEEDIRFISMAYGVPQEEMPQTTEEKNSILLLEACEEDPALRQIINRVNKDHVGLFTMIFPGSERMGSDMMPFYDRGYQTMNMWTSLHRDYHMPTDTADKIHGDMIQQVCRFVYLVAFEVADRAERLESRR